MGTFHLPFGLTTANFAISPANVIIQLCRYIYIYKAMLVYLHNIYLIKHTLLSACNDTCFLSWMRLNSKCTNTEVQ